MRSAPWKTELARAALTRFDVAVFRKKVNQLPAAIDDGAAPWYPIVLTALDTAEARRGAQRLWPDRLIDAATGDTMLGIHDHQHGAGPCMSCSSRCPDRGVCGAAASGRHRPDPRPGHARRRPARRGRPGSVDARAAGRSASSPGRTGLRAGPGDRPQRPRPGRLSAFDPVHLPPGRVPFGGRLLAAELGVRSSGNMVQYDGLFGPQTATVETVPRNPSCSCVTRADSIRRTRERRDSR